MNWNEAIQQLHNEPVTRGELSGADGRTLGSARVTPTSTLRDEFAMAALPGLCSMAATGHHTIKDNQDLAAQAFAIADAMLAERAKP